MNRRGRGGEAFPVAAVNATKDAPMLPQGVPEAPTAKSLHQAHKDFLFERLAALGIATVTAEYDGEGDSGQINDIEAFTAGNAPVDLSNTGTFTFPFYDGCDPIHFNSLHDFVDTLCWELLELYHAGFENNDGGFGTFTFTVADKQAMLTHNDRYTAFDTSTGEV